MTRDAAMGEPRKRITRMRFGSGPMGFLSDQIRKELQRAGYPPREFQLYRTPRQQADYMLRGHTKAKQFQSAHQYYAAADIIHEKWAWFAADEAPEGAQFWHRLWDCVEVVGEKYNLEFSDRIIWDPAHVQLSNWKDFKEVVGLVEPNQTQLGWYFQITLPAVWKQHERSKARAA